MAYFVSTVFYPALFDTVFYVLPDPLVDFRHIPPDYLFSFFDILSCSLPEHPGVTVGKSIVKERLSSEV